jgi:hypothetical protein
MEARLREARARPREILPRNPGGGHRTRCLFDKQYKILAVIDLSAYGPLRME